MHSIGIEHEGFAAAGRDLVHRGDVPRTRPSWCSYLAAQVRHPARPGAHPRPRPGPGHHPGDGRAACTGTRARTGTGSTTSTLLGRADRRARRRPAKAGSIVTIQPGFDGQRAAGHRLRRRERAVRAAGHQLRLPAQRPPTTRRWSPTSGCTPTASTGDDRASPTSEPAPPPGSSSPWPSGRVTGSASGGWVRRAGSRPGLASERRSVEREGRRPGGGPGGRLTCGWLAAEREPTSGHRKPAGVSGHRRASGSSLGRCERRTTVSARESGRS